MAEVTPSLLSEEIIVVHSDFDCWERGMGSASGDSVADRRAEV